MVPSWALPPGISPTAQVTDPEAVNCWVRVGRRATWFGVMVKGVEDRTVKAEGESAAPRAVTTWITPVLALVGTVVLMEVLVDEMTVAATPLKVSEVGFASPLPKIS